ncbi:MAG: hypothetical protein HY337_11760 [Gemmatimonadetes bacterium]|nr:hypothetical protein [Gemmatimonadota bacterium]
MAPPAPPGNTPGQARVFWHQSHRDHNPGAGHPESPARIAAILEQFASSPLNDHVTFEEPPPVDDVLLSRVHRPAYLRQLEAVNARGGGQLDADPVCAGRRTRVCCRPAARPPRNCG